MLVRKEECSAQGKTSSCSRRLLYRLISALCRPPPKKGSEQIRVTGKGTLWEPLCRSSATCSERPRLKRLGLNEEAACSETKCTGEDSAVL